ncbi:unnamed protein product [Orchesella dallaii]|uniref:Sodium-coupled monocarboxylate transporter 2 n=1 Tax=Orchesella dallaii TaxID=48710 RepID=A0ABP1R3Y6_9HEXA
MILYHAYILTSTVVATYAGCCPILLGQIKKPDAIIPYFVIEELAFIPGMMGIFVSCIFSAVLSSVSSTLNSLAAVTWEDFLSKIEIFKSMKSTNQAHCTKVLAVIYGVLSVIIAFGAQNLGALFQVVMTAVGATSGPLGGIFLCGLFIPFMNKFGAIVGILGGLSSMMFVAINSFILARQHVLNPRLPTDLDDCPAGTNLSMAINYTMPAVPEFDFPEKLYTLSYILYPFIGAVITTSVGVIVSILTGGFCNTHKVEKKYLHPWIRDFSCVRRYVRTEVDTNGFAPKLTKEPINSNSQYPYLYEQPPDTYSVSPVIPVITSQKLEATRVRQDKPQGFEGKLANQGMYSCFWDCGRLFPSQKEAECHQPCLGREYSDPTSYLLRVTCHSCVLLSQKLEATRVRQDKPQGFEVGSLQIKECILAFGTMGECFPAKRKPSTTNPVWEGKIVTGSLRIKECILAFGTVGELFPARRKSSATNPVWEGTIGINNPTCHLLGQACESRNVFLLLGLWESVPQTEGSQVPPTLYGKGR